MSSKDHAIGDYLVAVVHDCMHDDLKEPEDARRGCCVRRRCVAVEINTTAMALVAPTGRHFVMNTRNIYRPMQGWTDNLGPIQLDGRLSMRRHVRVGDGIYRPASGPACDGLRRTHGLAVRPARTRSTGSSSSGLQKSARMTCSSISSGAEGMPEVGS